MAAASTDRLVQRHQASRNRTRWEKRYWAQRDHLEAEREKMWRDAKADIASAEQWGEERNDVSQVLQTQLDMIYANGPSVLEIVQVKQAGFFARLWWALRFAWSKTLRFERIVEGQS